MFDIDLGAATSLSVTLLIIGIGMSVYPPLIIRTREKSHDYVITICLIVFFLILIAASQAVFLAKQYPDILIPLVGVTLGFRVLSPSILVSTLSQKSTNPKRWGHIRSLLLLVSLGLIFYTFISGITNNTNQDLAISERVLMTLAVAYTFSRAYVKVFRQFFFEWEERYILFSGLMVGISFVILIPFRVSEFDRIYKLTGTLGWLGAFLCLYRNRAFQGMTSSDDTAEDGIGKNIVKKEETEQQPITPS